MKNLKLNKLNQISEEMKNAVKGGYCNCTCGCCGRSSIEKNGNANKDKGYHTNCDEVLWGDSSNCEDTPLST